MDENSRRSVNLLSVEMVVKPKEASNLLGKAPPLGKQHRREKGAGWLDEGEREVVEILTH